ncbi:YcxB family protein [Anaerocolumna sp. MB42-C2]|uniref:YcxB family protein n=1 Tax=Anaerocolumna sp. MB42-C2 TaxID=3070997 RepID=UPI0027E1E863|nr:YcxB family protein [Anaerocolumna sp. MB42-C2]WMJ86041.1 YcxB family protein [Anaerocolumna sp. MB42-C2]
METVELKFKYTQAEYVKAHQQYLFASKIITKTSVIVLAFYLSFAMLYFFLSSFSVYSMIALGVGLFGLIVGGAVYYYLPIYQFKKTLKYHEEYNLTFSNASIKFKTSAIDSELRWNIYSEIWENADFYYLIQAPGLYALLPKRAFLSLTAKQVFEEMALSNLKSIRHVL